MALIVIVVVFLATMYFLYLRPQQRRAAEQLAMRQAVAEGTEVMLTSGIFGTVVSRTDDHVMVTVADGVTIKVLSAAIGRVVPEPEPEPEPEEEPGAESESDSATEPGDDAAAPEES